LFLAVAQLRWSSDLVPKSLIPQSALYSGTAPAAPSNLAAAPASGTQINLSWSDNALTETGFIIQRKQGATGTYAQVAIVPPNSTSYLDGELLAGTTYYYRVQAANFVSNSDFSNEASAATPVPPATPSNAHPTAVTTTSIAFAWQDNSNNEDKFSIFRSVNNGSFVFVADVPTNTTTYTDTGLSPGTSYDYHIQAWNLGGYTDFAGFSIITRATPPANPTAVVTNGQVSLAWTASPGAISYNVYRGTSPGGESAQPIASVVNSTVYTDNGLTSGFTYYYKITAVTTGGESSASTEVSASLGGGDGLLGNYYKGTALSGTAVQRVDPQVNFDWQYGQPMSAIPSDMFSVAWTGSIRPGATSAYTCYTTSDDGVRLYINGQTVINNWTQHGAAENASAPITLIGGQSYSLRMEYFENTGAAVAQLRWSSSQIAKSLIPQFNLYSSIVPTAPKKLTATKGTAKVTLTWTAASGAKSYNIYRGTSAGGEGAKPFATGVTTASFVDSGLNTGATYYYQVTAVNAGGESFRSSEVSAIPTGDGLLATYYSALNFTGIAVQRIDPQVNFNWQYGSPASGIPSDGFSAVWTGSLKPATTGRYTFYTTSDDGVRLYINGQLAINNWTDHGSTENASAPISLVAGQIYALRLEYYDHTGSAVAQLRWSSSTVTKALIPQSVLFSGSPGVQAPAIVHASVISPQVSPNVANSGTASISSTGAPSATSSKSATPLSLKSENSPLSVLPFERLIVVKPKRQLVAELFGFDKFLHDDLFANWSA
jgi:fibronectin type 3 domain-containing protein